MNSIEIWRDHRYSFVDLAKYSFLSLDIDECLNSPPPCHVDAACDGFQPIGSFTCSCRSGFTGNGTFCEGKHS